MMTYTRAARRAALQESRALRGYAVNGWPLPRCRPIDLWAEWKRLEKSNGSTFKGRAA